MGRPKKPIGTCSKHYTKEELDEKEKSTMKIGSDDLNMPPFLDKKYHSDFMYIANELNKAGVMSNLDVDVLAQYLIARGDYEFYDKASKKVQVKAKTYEGMITVVDTLKKYEDLKDKAFKQCQSCASSLGLTISARCKISLPKREEPEKPENPFMKFSKSG